MEQWLTPDMSESYQIESNASALNTGGMPQSLPRRPTVLGGGPDFESRRPRPSAHAGVPYIGRFPRGPIVCETC